MGDALDATMVASVRDRTLADNYSVHDVAERHVTGRLHRRGYNVVQIGTDDRHGDVKYGDGPDLAVRDLPVGSGVFPPVYGAIEVKAKRATSSGHDWYGWLNERHYNEYVEAAERRSHPVVIYMSVVHEDTTQIVRDGFYPLTEVTLTGDRRESHGNTVVQMTPSSERTLSYVCELFNNDA